MAAGKFCFSIDRGGTFTDIYAELPDGSHRVLKLLSEDPDNYPDAPREGIRRIIEAFSHTPLPRDAPLASSHIDWIRMGTTVATNALLERKGKPTLLVSSPGFADVLRIGNQSRPRIFDLTLAKASVIYARSIEATARLRFHGRVPQPPLDPANEMVLGTSGEWLEVLQPLNLEALREPLKQALHDGLTSVAVVLLHSYIYPHHEQQIGQLCTELGFEHISLSSKIMPMVKLVPRGQTTCVDAYLTPLITKYVSGFRAGFDAAFDNVDVSFMMSDGGLCPMEHFSGCRSILSGPAGGVVGYARTTYDPITAQPVIGFDMGGTSTDVSRFAGIYVHTYDTELAGVIVQAPQLDITTVAAGGGSKLDFRSGLMTVGPESVGAHPGPVCYRKGGQLAITDANLVLGRLLPDFFPKIFGKTENLPLDHAGSLVAFEALANKINTYNLKTHAAVETKSVEEIAYGFIEVANESMCRPIRAITEAKGFSASKHILSCFGGAGGQHACAIARLLGMQTVFVHRFAGILSAYGLGLADVVEDVQEPLAIELAPEHQAEIQARLTTLATTARSSLRRHGFAADDAVVEFLEYLNLKYEGTDTALMIRRPDDGDYAREFKEQYRREFGFLLVGRKLIVEDVRVRAIGKGHQVQQPEIETADSSDAGTPTSRSKSYWGPSAGWLDTPVYLLHQLKAGHEISGPAIIIDNTSTIVVELDCTATISRTGDIVIHVQATGQKQISATVVDSIQLSVFANRFMSIAEQMGRTLQRTSISTNIKERLDFSCALFGPDGGLVANAPHLPVHLGAMQEAVRWQIKHLRLRECSEAELQEAHSLPEWESKPGEGWADGQVIMSNHPSAGGSHLPDITVITPVFCDGKPVFYVASRGHHADIGGISPGSMPPFSRSLAEEGACVRSFKLVIDGSFREQEVSAILLTPAKRDEILAPNLAGSLLGSMAPISGTRNLKDNISDLQAQVAANNKGIQLVTDLIAEFSLPVVQAYMAYVQQNAENAVRAMLKKISLKRELQPIDTLHSVDRMDDGSVIQLALTIDRNEGSAIFDFTGTSPESYGNCNAPRAVTMSAIIYSLRCLVDMEIPLNQGCLNPIRVVVPDGTLLSPTPKAAVVGGNVLTSQRVTDVVLSAFGACACSQGCMNNLTFGDNSMGYYETIAGGGGAGPTWHGESAVHSHMTNTRITDAEIMERRYPVLVREFSIRKGSGGDGAFRGGDGVVRELEFLRPMSVGILSERRALAPRGIFGGHDGERGVNLLLRNSGHVVSLGPKNTAIVSTGDRLRILTPGGGGFGAV